MEWTKTAAVESLAMHIAERDGFDWSKMTAQARADYMAFAARRDRLNLGAAVAR